MNRLARAAGTAILSLAIAGVGRAQTVTVNGLADFGFVVPSHATSWVVGGFGKLDNGGDGRQGPAPVAQGLADLRVQLDPALSGFATLRLAPDQHTPLDVLEAYARYRPVANSDAQVAVKLGAFFPPISLENEAIGWTSPWTITPSAINSWVGDELRTIGSEANLEWRYRTGALGMTGAVFGWNDPAGTLLADRGWVFDSRPSGLFAEPRRADAVARENRLGVPLREEPFKEIGHSPGWYGGASWRQDDVGRVSLLYYDNRANPALHAGSDFGWRTRFASLGLETGIGDVVLLGQAMAGQTEIDPVPNFRSRTDFQSAFLLAGYHFGDFQVAGRIELFATQQRNSPGGAGPGEHGRALALSGGWRPLNWLRLMTEVLYVDSTRAQREAAGFNRYAREVQAQFVARLVF